jgi:Lrp/AsnC family leucine-responsive transcriptional regulator
LINFNIGKATPERPALKPDAPVNPAPDGSAFVLDHIDRKLISELIVCCRISNFDLSKAVHLSPSPCLRRRKMLEDNGVILAYTAIPEPAALGFGVAAFVEVCLVKAEIESDEFFRLASAFPEVAGCHATAGNFDYLLKVVTKDMVSLTAFIKDRLRAINGVSSTKVNLVLSPQPGIFAFYNYFHPIEEPIATDLQVRGHALDELDRRLIIALVNNARASNVELADELGISPSSCLRRLRMIEKSGAIRGYTTIVEPAALGLSIVAFVGLRLRRGLQSGEEEVRAALAARPEVAGMHETAGNVDFLLRVCAASVDDFGRFVRECLRKISAIEEMYWSFANDPPPVLFASYRFKSPQLPQKDEE